MAAHEVAQYVLEPFRAGMIERIEKGYCVSPTLLAKELGLPKTALHRRLASGELPGFRVGSLWRIKPEQIPIGLLERLLRPKLKTAWPEGALVYFVEGVEGFVKIGFTTNLRERVKDLQVGCPLPIRLLAHCDGDERLEREYHRRFYRDRLQGEWFKRTAEIDAEIAVLGPCLFGGE